MKKFLPIAAALALVLAGCGGSAPKAEDTTEEPAAVEEATEETTEETTEEADQGLIIPWNDATSAEEAAKGAGFEKFGVPASFRLGDLDFANPTFAYAGGVAQATYETPATMVTIRKAVGSYTTPLSDRSVDEFATQWNKVFEGVDVRCSGASRGAVTVATWSDGDKSYGVTFQGLGGEEMSMDSDELRVLVKGIQEANADQTVTEAKTEEQKKEETKTAETKAEAETKTETQKGALLSATEADKLVEKTCGGTCTAIDRVVTQKYGECWYATAVDAKGNKYEYYINNDGIYEISKTEAPKNQTQTQQQTTNGGHYEGEPVTIFDSIYAEWHQMNDGTWYAVFITYNGTQIFAKPVPAGSEWVFTAFANGTTYEVEYAEESSIYGQTGPAGVSSHWKSVDGSQWF